MLEAIWPTTITAETQHPSSTVARREGPGAWVAGDAPMNGPREASLHILARKAGEEVDRYRTKAEMPKRIEGPQH